VYMRAHADGSGTVATADAGVASVLGDPVLTLGSVTSHAGSTASSTTIVGEATTSVVGFTLGTNLPVPNLPIPANTSILSIDSITSIARSTSDGLSQIKPSGSITIGGAKVLGQPATIDQKGIHIGNNAAPVTPVVKALQDAARQALASIKFVISYAPEPELRVTGTQAVSEVSGVTMSFSTSDGASYKLTLGKAIAMADASPNTELKVEVPGVAGGAGLGGTEPAATGGAGVGAVTGGDSLGGASSTGSTGATGSSGASGATTLGGVLTSGSPPSGKGIETPLILLVILASGAFAFGMKRLSDNVLDEKAGMTCPNEGKTS
jgi:collagen type VII alpha